MEDYDFDFKDVSEESDHESWQSAGSNSYDTGAEDWDMPNDRGSEYCMRKGVEEKIDGHDDPDLLAFLFLFGNKGFASPTMERASRMAVINGHKIFFQIGSTP